MDGWASEPSTGPGLNCISTTSIRTAQPELTHMHVRLGDKLRFTRLQDIVSRAVGRAVSTARLPVPSACLSGGLPVCLARWPLGASTRRASIAPSILLPSIDINSTFLHPLHLLHLFCHLSPFTPSSPAQPRKSRILPTQACHCMPPCPTAFLTDVVSRPRLSPLGHAYHLVFLLVDTTVAPL